MNPTEIKQQLADLGIRAARMRGQHFLVDEQVLHDIVKAAEIEKNETILEIGPGLGVLTRALLQKAGRVVGVEIDRALLKHLEATLGPHGLELREGNVLDMELPAILGAHIKQYKLVANIPYNITSDILLKFLLAEKAPDVSVFLIQREVAERVTAEPPHMSRLGVLVQYFGKAEIVRMVSKEAFWPKPKVESAVVRIRRYPRDVLRQREVRVGREDFFRIVQIGFSAPRKKLVGNLAAGLHKDRAVILAMLEKSDIDVNARAESLTVDDWIRLAQLLTLK